MNSDDYLVSDGEHPIVEEMKILKTHLKDTGILESLYGKDPRRKVYEFPNGYGASLVINFSPMEWEKDKWELAVLHDGSITYDTDIADDVIRGLTWIEVEILLERIYNL